MDSVLCDCSDSKLRVVAGRARAANDRKARLLTSFTLRWQSRHTRRETVERTAARDMMVEVTTLILSDGQIVV